jgi:hypothetical protein
MIFRYFFLIGLFKVFTLRLSASLFFCKSFNSFSNSILGLSNLLFKTDKKNSLTTLSYSIISESSVFIDSSMAFSFMLFLQSSQQ